MKLPFEQAYNPTPTPPPPTPPKKKKKNAWGHISTLDLTHLFVKVAKICNFWKVANFCDRVNPLWQWLRGLKRHASTAIHLRITWLWLPESITFSISIVTSGKWYRFPFLAPHTSAWPTPHCLDLQWTGQHPTAPKLCVTFSNYARCGLQSARQQMPSNITTSFWARKWRAQTVELVEFDGRPAPRPQEHLGQTGLS